MAPAFTIVYEDGSPLVPHARVTGVPAVPAALVRAALPHRLRMDVPAQGTLHTHATASRWAPDPEPDDYTRAEEAARHDADAYLARVAYWRRVRAGYAHVHAGGGGVNHADSVPTHRAPRAPAPGTRNPDACTHTREGLPYGLSPYECAWCTGTRVEGEGPHRTGVGVECLCARCVGHPAMHDGRHGRSCGRCMARLRAERTAMLV